MRVLLTPRLRIALALAGLAAAACTEPAKNASREIAPVPAAEARIELSDSASARGAELRVLVRVVGSKAAAMASFTGRVQYDSTALRYVADADLSDGSTRVSNPQPGEIRAAAINAKGFVDGVITGFRFTVLNPAGARRLALVVEEMHDVDRASTASYLKVVRDPVIRLSGTP